MQEQLICRHVPIRGYLVQQPDGSFELDPERSTYADIPADARGPGARVLSCHAGRSQGLYAGEGV